MPRNTSLYNNCIYLSQNLMILPYIKRNADPVFFPVSNYQIN